MDRAVVILVATALVTILIDALSRGIRARIGAGSLRRRDALPGRPARQAS